MNTALDVKPVSRLRRIAQRRAVMMRLVRSDLAVKYEGSTLGYLWSILVPIMLTAVYFFVFRVVGLRTERVAPFDLFLLSGILAWQWFQGSVTGGLRSLRGNSGLITKVAMPREIFPISVVLAKGAEFMLSLIVLVGLAAIRQHPPTIYLLAFPLAVLIQATLLLGLGFLLSAINTVLRDMERVIQPLLRITFYMSGILYPIAIVGEKIAESTGEPNHILWILFRLNPVVGIMQLYRAAWFPDAFLGWTTVGFSAGVSVAVLLIGWRVFAKLERRFLKEL